MFLNRRDFVHAVVGSGMAAVISSDAQAQPYPSRSTRLIVGFAPGGATDIVGRLIGQWLSTRMGQQFFIENRTGAGGNIGTEAVVRAPPDGYTLLVVATANAVNTTLYHQLNFDFSRDIVPVASIAREPNVLVVNPAIPAANLSEFIAYAKANPKAIRMASAGNGTPAHVAGELFQMLTGVKMIHVPYRGGPPALSDLIGGQVQVMFSSISPAIPFIRERQLRAIAVTTAARSDALPDLPSVSELIPEYEASTWYGIGAPLGTPATIIERLNAEINVGLLDSTIRGRLASLGSAPLISTPVEFGKLIGQETEKWGRVIRAANISID